MRPGEAGAGAYPAPVLLRTGEDWVPATAHADRISRQGRQILLTHHGHLVWVAAHRVRPQDSDVGTHTSHRKRRRSPA